MALNKKTSKNFAQQNGNHSFASNRRSSLHEEGRRVRRQKNRINANERRYEYLSAFAELRGE